MHSMWEHLTKHMKKMLADIKGEFDSTTIIVRNFTSLFTSMDSIIQYRKSVRKSDRKGTLHQIN